MKTPILVTAILALVLSATAADAWARLRTEAEFRAQVVGRMQTVAGSGWVRSGADGSVTGEWQGQPVRGRWQWHNGYWCRNLIIGSRETGTNCLSVEIRGNQLRARQDQGRGTETIGTLN